MRLLSTIIFSFFSLLLLGQGTIQYAVMVTEPKSGPISGLKLVLIERNTFERQEFVTDATGKALIRLDRGNQWVLHVGNMKNYNMFEVPEAGNSSGSMMITYNEENWERINQPPVDRSKISLKVIEQKGITKSDFDAEHSIVTVTLKSKKGKAWKDIEVGLTNYKTNTTYLTTTGTNGSANLKVPISQNYQLDVDREPDYDYIDIGDRASLKQKKYDFERMDFKEELDKEGYFVQEFKDDPIATSNRTLVTFMVSGGPNDGANEDVYIEQTYSSNRFKVKTDKNGEAQILLPKGKIYIIGFEYQLSADVLDLTYFRGISSTSQRLVYAPDDRLLNPHNYLPSKKNVVAYDLNRFGNATPNLDSEELVNVTAKWGTETINSGSKEAVIELGFTARKPKSNPKRQPVSISFVLDKSGSMAGESFDLLKIEMLEIIDKLSSEDQVSLIFFDDQTTLAYPHQFVKNKEVLKDIIHTVQPGGGTNIYEGLKMGYAEMTKDFDPDGINRVILLTDGYGSQPIDFVLDQSKIYFEKGISVSAIGVGTDYNESLLNLLSKYSGGLQHHVIDKETINTAFKKEFDQLFTPIAKSLNVEVKYNDKIVYKALFGVPSATDNDNKVAFKLPKVYPSLNRLALVKFKLDSPNKSIEQKPIIITTSYFDEVKQEQVEIVKKMHLTWSEETNLEAIYDDQFRNLYSIATINQTLKAIGDLCDEGRFEDAKANLTVTLANLRKDHNNEFSPELIPVINQLEVYITALEYMIKNGR